MDINTSVSLRDFNLIKNFKYNDENVSTVTSREQKKTEIAVEKCFDRFQQLQFLNGNLVKIYREEHQGLLESLLHQLPTFYECLDCSRPWCIYWIIQASYVLNITFDADILERVVQFLVKCRHVDGGFAGGPGQYPHLAPTYAAVNTLATIGTPSAYCAIDRKTLEKFLFSVREADGSFRMHLGGEIDVRGAYCAVAVAKLTNMPEETLKKLFDKTGNWISSCQTYEGGFGGNPGLEAHGGYTFCGIAALALLNEGHKCNLQSLLKWALQRQMSFEGGFQGRTNKLVDGCYSFWVGAVIPITQAIIAKESQPIKKLLFDEGALQEYILLCCQKTGGGLIDKPGKPQDLYHTCYTLSGVAIAQHSQSTLHPLILGDTINELLPTHPLFNVAPLAVHNSMQHFERINKINQFLNSPEEDASSYQEEDNKIENTNNCTDIEESQDDVKSTTSTDNSHYSS